MLHDLWPSGQRQRDPKAFTISGPLDSDKTTHYKASNMIEPGQLVDRYRIVREIGAGSMGAVFEATHEVLGRRVAIRILAPGFAQDQQTRLRFLAEARIVSGISHPGVVEVIDWGQLQNGIAYMVMEYVQGELLSARLQKDGRLDSKTLLPLLFEVSSALAAAHSRGIVHRALSPDDIMLVPTPESPDKVRIKILNFGLAKLQADRLAAASHVGVTASGAIMGSPTYLTPEQCVGSSAVTDKADVYSLGVILYESLIGHPPFVAPGVAQIISMHLRDLPTPLRKLDKTISKDLATLVERMLAKQPAQRPEMREVVSALAALGASGAGKSAASTATLSQNAAMARGRVRYSRSIWHLFGAALGLHRTSAALDPEVELAQLDRGCFGLDAPRRMTVDVAVKVTVAAVRDRMWRPHLLASAEHSAPQIADAPLGRLVCVELIPDSPAEFTITPLSEAEQPVLRTELTQWEWLVTARHAGQRKRLRVRATNVVDTGGKRLTKSHPVRTIEVDVTVEAKIVSASDEVSTATLRRLLDDVLPSDATLEAFCLDYFPQVLLRFGGGMERLQKVTLLLSAIPPPQVLARLRDAEPEQLEALLAQLAPPLAPVAESILVLAPSMSGPAAQPDETIAIARQISSSPAAVPTLAISPVPKTRAAMERAWGRSIVWALFLLGASTGIYRCVTHSALRTKMDRR